MAGIRDILAKSLGSSNGINVAHATIAGFKALRRPDEVAALRGKQADEVTPGGVLRAYRERKTRDRPLHGGHADMPARPPKATKDDKARLVVTQTRSAVGSKPKHRGTLRALGLRGIGQSNDLPDRGNPRHAGPRAASDEC